MNRLIERSADAHFGSPPYLFNRISSNSGRMVLRSLDMKRGAARMAHIPICAFD